MKFGIPTKSPIGDMKVYIYISPILPIEHQHAAKEAIYEFFKLFPTKQNWFKIQEAPCKDIENIINNQPISIKELTDLHFFYYEGELQNLYKTNLSPWTSVLVIPHNYISASNGSGGGSCNSVIIFDLQNITALKSTIKHELGHRFNCKHCNDANCIMNPSGVGSYFCHKHMNEMQLHIATMYENSRIHFLPPRKPSFTFGSKTKN